MADFKTNLDLGQTAYVVRGSLDYWVEPMTVGQVRVIRTMPKARGFDNDKCYVEEYMCLKTGVGSGNVYEYGKSIFGTETEANAAVIRHQQKAYKKRAEREKYQAEQEKLRRERELLQLKELKEKYEQTA